MSVLSHILAVINLYEINTGKKATAIYWGRTTREEALKDVDIANIFQARANIHERETISGIPIFIVDDERHFNIG